MNCLNHLAQAGRRVKKITIKFPLDNLLPICYNLIIERNYPYERRYYDSRVLDVIFLYLYRPLYSDLILNLGLDNLIQICYNKL